MKRKREYELFCVIFGIEEYMMEEENRLSLSDIIMPYVYIRSLLIYDYHIDDFEESLNEYLHLYCPQSFKCIVYNDNNMIDGQIVDCEERKIYSHESRINESISKYFDDNTSVEDLFPYGLIPTDSSPLIFIHKIDFKDGTILSFGCHHYLSDGHGFSLLGQRFSEWLKGKKSFIFDHDRSKLKHIAASSSIKFDHSEMSIIEPVYPSFNSFSTETIIKRYTKKYLFEKLQITSINVNISFNDVLVGWLTQIISRIRQISSETTVKVGMAMNGRCLLPNIDENYFGNCSFYLCLSFLMSDLNNFTVNELSEKINIEKRKLMTREYIQSSLAFINQHHRTSIIHLGWKPFNGIDLSFTNWSKFPLYKCNFGQGQAKSFNLLNTAVFSLSSVRTKKKFSFFPIDDLSTIYRDRTQERVIFYFSSFVLSERKKSRYTRG
jgi:hypothetical protein